MCKWLIDGLCSVQANEPLGGAALAAAVDGSVMGSGCMLAMLEHARGLCASAADSDDDDSVDVSDAVDGAEYDDDDGLESSSDDDESEE